MIHLYTSKRAIPKDKEFITNIDPTFNALIYSDSLRLNSKDEEILRIIDKSKLSKSCGYVDTPFGNNIPISNISTGSKTLILINHFKESSVIDISQCGRNVLNLAFQIDNTNYYLSYCITPDKMKPVIVNNRRKIYKTSSELLEIWRDLE